MYLKLNHLVNCLDSLDREEISLSYTFPVTDKKLSDFVSQVVPTLQDKMLNFNKQATLRSPATVISQSRLSSAATYLERYILSIPTDRIITLNYAICLGIKQLIKISEYHPFSDGNKRTAFLTGIYIVNSAIGFDDYTIPDKQQEILAYYGFQYLSNTKDKLAYHNFYRIWESILVSQICTNYKISGEM